MQPELHVSNTGSHGDSVHERHESIHHDQQLDKFDSGASFAKQECWLATATADPRRHNNIDKYRRCGADLRYVQRYQTIAALLRAVLLDRSGSGHR